MFATCRSSNVTDASCILRAELNEEAEVPRTSQYSPLLMAVSHFMLAMILHIREQLMDSDSTGILGYLLKVTTHSLTHSLTHSRTRSLTYLLTHLLVSALRQHNSNPRLRRHDSTGSAADRGPRVLATGSHFI